MKLHNSHQCSLKQPLQHGWCQMAFWSAWKKIPSKHPVKLDLRKRWNLSNIWYPNLFLLFLNISFHVRITTTLLEKKLERYISWMQLINSVDLLRTWFSTILFFYTTLCSFCYVISPINVVPTLTITGRRMRNISLLKPSELVEKLLF